MRSGPPRVGTVEWERAGGPPLSFAQRVATLLGAAGVVVADLAPRLRFRLLRSGTPPKVDLASWAPPDTAAARRAEEFLRRVSSPAMVHHSLRTYWFSAIVTALAGEAGKSVDRETLYVAALMHDVGLFEDPRPDGERCFTVGGAREARRIASEAGWDQARQDRMAMAITGNLNSSLPIEVFGPEAHWLLAGGKVEVLAQEWRVHPENLAEILALHPRDGFADDSLAHVAKEARLNPGGRFACLDPVFPFMVRRSRFSIEDRPKG